MQVCDMRLLGGGKGEFGVADVRAVHAVGWREFGSSLGGVPGGR